VTNSGILVVTLRAPTPELAKQLAGGNVAEIVDDHNQLIASRLRYAGEVFQNFRKNLDRKTSKRARSTSKYPDWKPTSIVEKIAAHSLCHG
jgi:hypothetical protein